MAVAVRPDCQGKGLSALVLTELRQRALCGWFDIGDRSGPADPEIDLSIDSDGDFCLLAARRWRAS